MNRSKNIIKQLSSLVLISILSKILGFLREFVIAYKLGTSVTSDAYFLAITISITFCGGILSAFSTSFIPIYSQLKEISEDESQKFINKLQSLIFVFQFFIIGVFFLSKNYILDIFFGNSNVEMIKLVNKMSGIMIFYIIVSGIRTTLGGFLQYNNKTSIVYFGLNILQNIIILLSIIIYTGNVDVLSYGYVIAGVVVSLYLIIYAKRYGFKFSIDLNWNSLYVKQAVILTIPIFSNQILLDINTFFDKSIASGLGIGIVSSLNYAYKINDIFVGTFATTLATALYPELSKLLAGNNFDEAARTLKNSIKQISMLLLPFTMLILLFSDEIVDLLFLRGAFEKESAIITSQCLKCYSLGMIFFAYRQILYRAMLSCRLSNKILKNSFFVVLINISLNFVLSKYIGYIGIALATGISITSMTLLMINDLYKHGIGISLYEVVIENIKYLVLSIFSFICVYLLYKFCLVNLFFMQYSLFVFITCVFIGLLMYVMILKISKDSIYLEFELLLKIRGKKHGIN